MFSNDTALKSNTIGTSRCCLPKLNVSKEENGEICQYLLQDREVSWMKQS